MNNFFEKFPIISYQNNPAINLLSKIQFDKTNLTNTQLFHPYTLRDGERPDVLAFDYYGDSRYAWIIYLTNRIVDPYYSWPLTDEEFKRYLIKKYGSVENAYKKIAYYRVETESDDRILTESLYEQLPAILKKYWNPIFGENENIIGYDRKKLDEARETNQTVYLEVDDTSVYNIDDIVTTNTSYTQLTIDTNQTIQLNETIQQGSAVGTVFWNFSVDTYPKTILVRTTNGIFTANSTNAVSNSIGTSTILNVSTTNLVSEATVKGISNNRLIVQHVLGKFESNYGYLEYEGSTGTGELVTENNEVITSETTSSALYVKNTDKFAFIMNVTDEVLDSNGNTINKTISDLEYVYWEPVSSFIYELELNDSKKFIYLLDKTYLNKTEKQVSDILL